MKITYMNVLISYVSLIIRIRPVSVHELDGLVSARQIQRVVKPKHEFFYLLFHEHPINLETRT